MRFLIVFGLICAAHSAIADDYRYQVDVNYTDVDVDPTETAAFGFDALDAAGRFYFDAVEDAKGPLIEAAFLNKASSAGLGLRSGEDSFDDSISGFAADIRYVTNGASLILEASYGDSDFSSDYGRADITSFHLGLGKYIGDVTTIVLRLAETDVDNLNDDPVDDESISTIALEFRRVQQLKDSRAISLQADLRYIDPDNSSDEGNTTSLTLSADYFFSNRVSIGLLVGGSSGDGPSGDGTTYGVQADYFFSSQIGLSVAYTSTDFDDVGDTADRAMIGIVGRF